MKNKKQKTTWNPHAHYMQKIDRKYKDDAKPKGVTIKPGKRQTFVLAGCMGQFNYWCSRNGYNADTHRYTYVASVNDIIDKSNFDLVCYGTYHDRYDWLLIINRSKDRGAIITRV